MHLILTDDETMLKDSIGGLVSERSPIEAFRALRDDRTDPSYAPLFWKDLVEMGLAGILIPENWGGADFGMRGAGIVAEELGRTLSATPFLGTAIGGAKALLLAGSAEQQAELLPKIASGSTLICLALNEGANHNPETIAATIESRNGALVLNGEKRFVADGGFADYAIVSAQSDAGPVLAIVPCDAPGIARTNLAMVDGRDCAHLAFDEVELAPAALLTQGEDYHRIVSDLLATVTLGLAAEMLGSAQAAFEITMAYIKERRQFDKTLSSFQALQHRSAEMYCDLELTRSVILEGLTALDNGHGNAPQLASLAKAMANDTLHKVSNEGIQMHGGVGVTDEYDIGLFLKRARVAEKSFGDTAYHQARYAELSGF